MEIDPGNEVPGVRGLIMELNLDDEETETLLLQLITGYVLAADNGEVGMDRYCRVINAIGSSIAHNTTQEKFDTLGMSEEDGVLDDGDNWTTSPKDLTTYLLDNDLLLDKEFLASSYKQFCVVKELDAMFELPDAIKSS